MIIISESNKWVQNVEPKILHGLFPEGTFLKKAESIVKQLLVVNPDVGLAIKRLTYYINRGGHDVPNKDELERAKQILEQK